MKNGLDEQYIELLEDILKNGIEKETRNGKVLSVFGRSIRYKFKDGKFPLITTKKIAFKTMVTELLWFLRGDTNIKFLVDNNCHIWDGDCYQAYVKKHKHAIRTEGNRSEIAIESLEKQLIYTQEEFINKIKTDDEFAKKWGSLGKIYGHQWRKWETTNVRRRKFEEMYNMSDDSIVVEKSAIDQIANLINDLKTNPDSRRMVVSAWAVHDLPNMVLPPCHYGFQVYTRELSHDERFEIYKNSNIGGRVLQNHITAINFKQFHFDEANIPTRAISLMWNQRSVDTFLGLPFNIASYGLLLEIIAKEVNMVPDELIGNLGDVHLYSNHIEQAKEQIGREMTLEERYNYGLDVLGYEGLLDYGHSQNDDDKILDFLNNCNVPKRTREPFPLPTLKHMKTEAFYKSLSEEQSLYGHLDPKDFQIENYQSHPSIKAPLSN
jgi:thymidylate synthase